MALADDAARAHCHRPDGRDDRDEGETDLSTSRRRRPTASRPRQLDALVANELPADAQPPLSADEAFLRRASFDLIGRQPTVAEQQQFAADSSPDKRQQLVERLLASEEFGANWANYWSDTIAYRVPPPELTYLDYRPLKGWLAEQAQRRRAWDEIVRELITATGKVADVPAATFVGYHQANATNLAAETSRIFLGQQILCAQCHDHPFDHWKRTAVSRAGRVLRPHQGQAPLERRTGHRRLDGRKGRVPDARHGRSREAGQQDEAGVPDPTTTADPRIGKDDAERRARLADWVTSTRESLVRQGLYQPHLGPTDGPRLLTNRSTTWATRSTPLWPAVHEALAGHFLRHRLRREGPVPPDHDQRGLSRGVTTAATRRTSAGRAAPGSRCGCAATKCSRRCAWASTCRT